MSAAAYLVPSFRFRVGPLLPPVVSSKSVLRKSRSEESSEARVDNAGLLVGSASLYLFLVAGLLWSAPAWMVIFAPFVQVGVGRLMLWALWR